MAKTFTFLVLLAALVNLNSCIQIRWKNADDVAANDSTYQQETAYAALDTQAKAEEQKDTFQPLTPTKTIDTKNVSADEVVSFAKTLIGTPYVYASTNPAVGFDCSGFITYVFNHFGIAVPRSSVDFTAVGKTINETEARPGDLILFTGTNPAERQVGHMGLVVANGPDSLQFIHSSSGKAMGVTITPLNDYYRTRFVRITRIFP